MLVKDYPNTITYCICADALKGLGGDYTKDQLWDFAEDYYAAGCSNEDTMGIVYMSMDDADWDFIVKYVAGEIVTEDHEIITNWSLSK